MRPPTLLAFGLASCVLGLPNDVAVRGHKSASTTQRGINAVTGARAHVTDFPDGSIDNHNKRDDNEHHSMFDRPASWLCEYGIGESDYQDHDKCYSSPDDNENEHHSAFDRPASWLCDHGIGGSDCHDHDKRTAAPAPQSSAFAAPIPDFRDAYDWLQEKANDISQYVDEEVDDTADYLGDKACDHGMGGSACQDRDKRAAAASPQPTAFAAAEQQSLKRDIIPDAVRTADTVIDDVLTILASPPTDLTDGLHLRVPNMDNGERDIIPDGIRSVVDDGVRSIDTVIDNATTMPAGQSDTPDDARRRRNAAVNQRDIVTSLPRLTGETSVTTADSFDMGVPIPGFPLHNVPLEALIKPGDVITGTGTIRSVTITAVFSLESIHPNVVAQTWSIAGVDPEVITVTASAMEDAFAMPTPMAVVDANVKREKTTRLQTFTMTVVDEEPGERTLNTDAPASLGPDVVVQTVTLTRPTSNGRGSYTHLSTHARMSTHTVHVVHQDSTKVTLSPTSVAHGTTVYVTRSGDWTTETASVDLGAHGAQTITRYHSVSASSDANVKTVKVIDLGSTKATLSKTTNSLGASIYVTATGSASGHHYVAASTQTVSYTISVSSRPVVTKTITRSTHSVMLSTSSPSLVTKTITNTPHGTTATQVVSGALPTVTKTIYRTVICESGQVDMNMQTTTVADINGSPLTVTGSSGVYGQHHDTVVIVAPAPEATLHPLQCTEGLLEDLLQFNLDAYRLSQDYAHIMRYDAASLRERYADMDWSNVASTAGMIRTHYSGLDWDQSVRRAVCWELRQSQEPRNHERGLFGGKSGSKATTTSAANVTMTRALIGSTLMDVSQSQQTIGGTLVVTVDPYTPFDLRWAAQQTPMASPPGCLKGKGSHYNKTECNIQKCMLKHYKPLNITTVFPAVMDVHTWPFGQTIDYFTHVTSLTRAHWGTTERHGIYYPLKTTVMPGFHGSPTVTVVRETPRSLKSHRRSLLHPLRYHNHAKGVPECWSLGTCCQKCNAEAKLSLFKRIRDSIPLWAMLMPLALLPLLASLLGCCVYGRRKHRKNKVLDPNASVIAILPGIPRRKTNNIAIVDPSTQVIEIVSPATAPNAVPLPAPINEKSGAPRNTATTTAIETTTGGDGRGTLSRRAEEGRGRVQFANDRTQPEATAPVTTTPTTVVTAPQGPAKETTTTEHVDKPTPVADEPTKPVVRTSTIPAATTGKPEPIPEDPAKPVQRTFTTPAGQPVTVVETVEEAHPARVDGAADGRPTGSEMAEMGSMRGRKTNRPAGGRDLFNVGF